MPISSRSGLSRVSRSFRAAACRRLWPLEHFDLRVVEVPYDPRRDENELFLYEVSGEGVRCLADEQEFDWGEQDGDFYRAGGVRQFGVESVLISMRSTLTTTIEVIHPPLSPDGRVHSLEAIPQVDREALQRARVLHVNYPLNPFEALMTDHLMPHLHTVRFLPVDY